MRADARLIRYICVVALRTYQILWCLILALILVPGMRASAQSGFETAPPEGFEDLMRPQTNLVDVYFGGRLQGQVTATFEPGRLTFANPAAVVALVSEIEDPEPVTAALSGPLDTNTQAACRRGQARDECGTLSPPVAAIIFDDARFRVDLFVNPEYLSVQPFAGNRFAPTPTRPWSLVNFASGAMSASSGRRTLFNLRNRSILGMRGGRAIADLSFSSEDEIFVDALLGEWDRRGMHAAAGLFRTRGLDLIGQVKILGGRFDTDTRTRLDLQQAEGSPLVVFLPRRAQVEVLRDGRLLSSAIYEAGNQEIDTRLLPEGAYTVTIRIREDGAVVREEERFFVKSTDLPPRDQPLFVVEAGMLVDDRDGILPTLTDRPIARLGVRHRLRDWLGAGANLLITDDQVVGEVNASFLTRFGTFRLVGLGSSEGDVGVGVTAFGGYRRFSYSLNLRRIWSTDSDPFLFADPDDFDPITGSFTQADVRLSYRLGDARLGFVGVVRDSDRQSLTYAVGPTLYWPFWRRGPWRAELQGSATVSDDETLFFATVRLRYSEGPYRLTGTAGLQGRYGYGDGRTVDDRLDAITRLDGSYRFRDLSIGEIDLFAGAGREVDTSYLRAGSDYRGRFGQGTVEGEHRLEGDGPRERMSGTYTVGVAVNRDGVAVGGRQNYDSAVIVRVRGTARGSSFDVLIDDAVRGRVETGGSVAVFLRPYETYRVSIRPAGNELVNLDVSERTVSLYPGTAETIVWRADRVIVVYGRIVTPDGAPVAGSLIEGTIGVAETDGQGYFQAEVGSRTELRLTEAEPACSVQMPALEGEAEIVNVGTLVCR